MDPGLGELLRHPAIWRGHTGQSAAPVISTGFPVLDRQLPGGGWPASGLIEVLIDQPGRGELGLLVPALVALHERYRGAWLALVQPPHEPYAPALAAKGIDLERLLVIRTTQACWSLEQVLRSGGCRCALGWMQESAQLRMAALRRLQFAAVAKGALCILVRPVAAGGVPSPAGLRLLLAPQASGLRIRILKCRGGRAGEVNLDWPGTQGG